MKRIPENMAMLIAGLHTFNINPATREIYIGGMPTSQDDEEIGVNNRMATEVIRNLTFLDGLNDDPILIHMCTIGGEWEYGMAIYDAIRACRSWVTIRAYAHARSMSSIILQAADTRQMMPSAVFMVHEGSIMVADTHKGAMTALREAEKEAQAMLDVYINRGCKPTAAEIQKMMDSRQEWFLSAHEAVKLGFADEVYE